MTHIKICGITNRADALAAAEAGADALGFIAVPGSPRYVDTQQQFEISEDLPLFVRRVVVVQRPEDAEDYGLDYVQYYEDTPHWICAVGSREERIRAFRMRDEASLREIEAYRDPVGAILLDTYHKGMLGGVGRDVRLVAGGAGEGPDGQADHPGGWADAGERAGGVRGRAALRRGCGVRRGVRAGYQRPRKGAGVCTGGAGMGFAAGIRGERFSTSRADYILVAGYKSAALFF